MKKTKTEDEIIQKEIYKVKFLNTYIGSHGIYYEGLIYELSKDIYEILKDDCEEI
jgi:hypothetical protein